VALTGNASVGPRESCLAAGMNDCLSKPFEPAEFHAAIDRWSRREGFARQRSYATSPFK